MCRGAAANQAQGECGMFTQRVLLSAARNRTPRCSNQPRDPSSNLYHNDYLSLSAVWASSRSGDICRSISWASSNAGLSTARLGVAVGCCTTCVSFVNGQLHLVHPLRRAQPACRSAAFSLWKKVPSHQFGCLRRSPLRSEKG